MDREGTGVELAVGKRNSRAVSSESVLSQWWLSIRKQLCMFFETHIHLTCTAT